MWNAKREGTEKKFFEYFAIDLFRQWMHAIEKNAGNQLFNVLQVIILKKWSETLVHKKSPLCDILQTVLA